MSFDVEQCRKDGWKCEVCNCGIWTEAQYQATDRNGLIGYSIESDRITAWTSLDCIRNLPPKPKEPTEEWERFRNGRMYFKASYCGVCGHPAPLAHLEHDPQFACCGCQQKRINPEDTNRDDVDRLWSLAEGGATVMRIGPGQYHITGCEKLEPSLTAAVRAVWSLREKAKNTKEQP